MIRRIFPIYCATWHSSSDGITVRCSFQTRTDSVRFAGDARRLPVRKLLF